MKKLLCGMCALLLLTGCSASGSYVYSRPHTPPAASVDAGAINDRAELTDAISAMLRAGVQSDTLQISDYEGDLDAELERITAELTENDPYGAYAVSTIVCKQVSILSRTELTVSVQYSRSAQEIAAVSLAPTADDLALRISEALSSFSTVKTFYLDGVRVTDPEALVEKCWLQDPAAAVGLKSYTVASYPATGAARILELTVEYLDTPDALQSMGVDVARAARAVCSEFTGESDRDRVDFVYAYLRDNVVYDTDAMRVVSETGGRQARTAPYTAYGALIEGRAAQSGIALAAKALCDTLELPAAVLSGTLNEEPHVWLNVSLDGTQYHFDPTFRPAEPDTPVTDTPQPDTPETPPADADGYLMTLTEGRRTFLWKKSLYNLY